MEPALLDLLTERLTHQAYVSQDAYGKPTYGPAQQHPARVEFRVRKIVDLAGQERISRARVFFDGTVTIDLRDKIVLPDGTAPPILLCYTARDVDGSIHHWELSF